MQNHEVPNNFLKLTIQNKITIRLLKPASEPTTRDKKKHVNEKSNTGASPMMVA